MIRSIILVFMFLLFTGCSIKDSSSYESSSAKWQQQESHKAVDSLDNEFK